VFVGGYRANNESHGNHPIRRRVVADEQCRFESSRNRGETALTLCADFVAKVVFHR
jgi:hypothetical protein